jgi:hypothetical protein
VNGGEKMTDQKQKGPQVRQHLAGQGGNYYNNSISRVATFWALLCDADLSTFNVDASYYRQLVKVSEMHDLFVRYEGVFH